MESGWWGGWYVRGELLLWAVGSEAVLLVRSFLGCITGLRRRNVYSGVFGGVVGDGEKTLSLKRDGWSWRVCRGWGWGGVSLVTLTRTLQIDLGQLMIGKSCRACCHVCCLARTFAWAISHEKNLNLETWALSSNWAKTRETEWCMAFENSLLTYKDPVSQEKEPPQCCVYVGENVDIKGSF